MTYVTYVIKLHNKLANEIERVEKTIFVTKTIEQK